MSKYHEAAQQDLATRVFSIRAFQAAWALFLFVLLIVSWPIRDALLVCCVYGIDAYFHKGLRLLPGKPLTFSNGVPVPVFADMATGILFFFAVTLGLSLSLIFALRLYERISVKRKLRSFEQ